jgi:ABC-type Fe3+ transport system permease subunit
MGVENILYVVPNYSEVCMLFINTLFVVQVVCSLLMYFFVKHVDTRDLDEKWCDKLELSGGDRERYTNIVNTLIFTILAIPFVIVLVFSFLFALAFGGGKND